MRIGVTFCIFGRDQLSMVKDIGDAVKRFTSCDFVEGVGHFAFEHQAAGEDEITAQDIENIIAGGFEEMWIDASAH